MEGFILIIAAVVVILIVISISWWISTSNGLKIKSLKVSEALSGIEVALTKRYDMLTKLLDVAKGYAKHETDLFARVIELRRGMTVSEINEKNGQLDALSTRIFAVAENYPQLRSSDMFVELQKGIRDAEEHLQAARRLYNSNVTAFNTAIDIFPSSIVAKSQHLARHNFFETDDTKRTDVKMSF